MEHRANLTRTDFLKGLFFSSMTNRISQLMYVFFAGLFTYMSFGSAFKTFGMPEIVALLLVFVFYLIVMTIFVFFSSLVYTFLSPGLKKGILGSHTFVFRDQDFVEKTPYNESVHKYNSISKAITLWGDIYIYLAGGHWYMLPKHDFQSNREKYALLDFIRQKIE